MAKFHFKPFSSLLLLLKLLATNCQKILPEKFCKRLMDGAGYWKVVGTYLTYFIAFYTSKEHISIRYLFLMSLALYEGRRVGKLNWLLCCAHWMFRSVKDFLDHEPIGIRFDLIGLCLPILCTYLKNVSAWAENISKKLTYYFVSKKEILPTYALFSNPAFSILFHAWCNVSCKTKSVNSLENQFICK